MFDTHLHFESLGDNDLMDMTMAGITDVVGAIYYPHLGLKYNCSTIKDLFERLFGFESIRAKENRINLYYALGVNMVSVPVDYEKLLEELPSLLKSNSNVVALGEIGFEPSSETLKSIDDQEKLFRRQVEIAREVDLPIICHTPNPKELKYEYSKKLLDIIDEMSFDPKNVIIDHASDYTAELILERGAWCGLTVQPWRRFDPINAAETIMKIGVERVLVNSDFSFKRSDHLVAPKTAYWLRRYGMSEENINKIFVSNPKEVYKIKA